MSLLLSVVLSSVFFTLAILNPGFYPPWSGFISEYLVFWSLLALLPLFFKHAISIPKISLIFLLLIVIPIIQYSLGQIAYFDTAALSVIYISCFWLAVIVGFNSAKRYKSSLDYFFLPILGCGLVSSAIAIAQWLNISMSVDWVMPSIGQRPFANMAQPNHLATFLLIAILACVYLYENKKINNIVLSVFSLLLLVAVAMTLSRTAWVSVLFVYLYGVIAYKRNILNLSFKKQSLFLGFFIGSIFLLPIIKASVSTSTANIANAAQRASSGFERINHWQRALESIKQQPLWGYGWNQSAFAQYDNFKIGSKEHYLSSFHNIFLDIIIWCGIPIGITIILICTSTIIRMLIKSNTASQVCLISSVNVILIHSLLEYPLLYSYFLLPLGFMLGFLFFSFKSKSVEISGFYLIIVFAIGILSSVYIFREYSHIPDNMVAAETHEMNKRKDSVILPYKLYFFESFEKRANWISLYPCTQVSEQEINEIRNMVKTYFINYDLYKFSQLLYFNGYSSEAQKHLDLLNGIYERQYKLNDLQCVDTR